MFYSAPIRAARWTRNAALDRQSATRRHETKAKRSEKKVKTIDVSLVEAKGVFSGGMAMPGAPAPATCPTRCCSARSRRARRERCSSSSSARARSSRRRGPRSTAWCSPSSPRSTPSRGCGGTGGSRASCEAQGEGAAALSLSQKSQRWPTAAARLGGCLQHQCSSLAASYAGRSARPRRWDRRPRRSCASSSARSCGAARPAWAPAPARDFRTRTGSRTRGTPCPLRSCTDRPCCLARW